MSGGHGPGLVRQMGASRAQQWWEKDNASWKPAQEELSAWEGSEES